MCQAAVVINGYIVFDQGLQVAISGTSISLDQIARIRDQVKLMLRMRRT